MKLIQGTVQNISEVDVKKAFMSPKLTVSALILFQALGTGKTEQKASCISCFDEVRNVWWQFWCYFWSHMNKSVAVRNQM